MKNKLMQKAMKIFLALILLLNCVGMPARAEGEGKETITYAELITDLEDLQADDQIIIVNKAHKKALSQVYNGYYNSGEDVTVSDDRIYEYNDTAVWTLGVTDAGTYQFKTADGKKLSMAATRTSMPLDDANDTWNITAVTGNNGVFFIDNTGRAGYRIEWYSTNNNWSAYNNNATGDLFQQQIFRITEGEAPSNIPVASITLNDTTLSLDIGETAQLTAEVLPETATDKSVTWASDDPTVATVDGNGLVTAVALGTASITVTANDGSGVNAICGVRVNDPEAVFTDGLVTDLSQLKDGSKVVIYNDSAAKAISTSVLQSYYLSPVDVTIQDDKAMNPAAEAVWTLGIIENADGTKSYTFSTSEGKKMSMNNDRNSLPLDAENMTWTLPAATTADSWYIVNENRPTYYVEWYARYTEFSTYTYAANNEAIYAMKLYVIAETAEDVPIASLALDHETLDLEAGQTGQLTPVIEPENATNKALTWTSSDEMVATVDVNGLVTAVAAGTATIIATTTDGSDKTASCTVIVAEGSAPTYLEKLTEAPEDGAKVVIYYPVDGLVLTAVPNGKKLTGTAALPADGKLEQTDDMALLTVSTGDNGQYEFVSEDGKYLTSPATGNGLSFADASSDYSKWALSQNADGTWTITNVSAVYNGQQQALEYYSGFTTYGVKDTNVYHFDFYGTNPVTEGLVTDLSTLEDGDLIVVYNESGNYAMSNTTVAQYYRGLETVTIEDDKVVNPAETAIWTLGVSTTDDGTTYTFTTQDGHVLTAGTKNSLPLDDVNPDWTIVPAGTAGYFYIINAGRNTQYIEYYAAKSDFSSYKYVESDDAVYLMKLYKVKKGSTPVEGDTYGLASTIADGDKVILFNEKNKVAIGNTITSYKINGVSLTPVEDVITTDNTAVVWTVVKNADGTYSFTQGDYTLGGYVREDNGKTYNNLTVSDATYTNWTLTGPDSSDFNYFLYLDDMANNYGKMYLEYYNGFTLYGSSSPDKDAFGIRFYKQGADPETPSGEIGDLVTDLNQLEDGTTVAIYSPGHKTAISTRPNGDWYLKANAAYLEGGKVVNFTSDFVWKIRKNADGTYTFVSNDDENNSIAVWRSDTTDANGNPKSYAELTVDSTTYPENKWVLTPAKTANCYYFNNPSVTDDNNYTAYIEAYVRNGTEVYSGYFTNTSSNKFTEKEFALQFYLINPDDAVESFDDGEWDKVLNKDSSYVIYSPSCEKSLGLFKEANYAFDAIDTTIADNKATPGNGAYVFKIDTMGRYYSFEVNGKYMASNNEEELYFVEKGEDGKLPDNAKWYLKPIGEVLTNGTPAYDGYVIFNKDANYKGSAVCIEYYSSVFSGWTFKSNDSSIFIFQFYPVAEGVDVFDDTVQDPSVVFDCNDSRHLEEDYHVSFTLDDLAANITDISISYKVGEKEAVPVTDYETTSDGKGYSFDLKAEDIDGNEKPESFKILVDVTNSYGISYTGEKTVAILDTPFFADLTPAPNAQTGDDKRPVISAKVGNVGEAPTFTMKVNDELVEAVYENGILSWTSAEDMADGRVSVHMICTRADGVSEQQSWSFIVGTSAFQLYFGQLHSHTTYSDGSGTLETALEYIESLPESANVDFVAFTDHSNYFDTTSASNPADAMHDVSLMTPASAALWNQYKETVADFNSKHTDIVAIAGYEMTWSGGPGHINSYNTKGLVSRNNAALNNKSDDAGMKLYYETIAKDTKGETMHQFNHPGSTFGNFSDFAYWSEDVDKNMYLVEVGNGEGQIGAGGYYPSYEQYTLALDNGWHIAPTNNQDNHKGRWGNANDARDVVLAENFTEEAIYDAIKALRVYATEDKNFELTYLVNGEQMGKVFTKDDMPEKMNVEITMFDPDSGDSVKKVELVVDNGKTAYTWDDPAVLAEGLLTAELDIQYTYYFIRVTQNDGDLIVTAPVWFGSTLQLGIESIAAAPETITVGENVTLTPTFFNNEEQEATVTSIIYTVNGSQVLATDTTPHTIAAGQTLDISQVIGSFDTAKHVTVTVTAVMKCGEREITVTKDVEFNVVDPEAGVSTIAAVRAASDPADTGYVFTIEGVVTSNASGYDKDTAFFDCIYVQDETGGICCFPVSGLYKIGDKVRIIGYTDFYQGEPELQVEKIEIIGEGTVEPKETTSADINNRVDEGLLVTLKGTVESYEVENGLVLSILVKDFEGNVARVFIDGYITTENEVKDLAEGATIEATGLASYDDTWHDVDHFARIRVRDRADVICKAPAVAKEFTVEDLADVTYNGAEQKQTVVVKDAETGTVLTADTDYTVAYEGDPVNVGTVTVTITGKGDYTSEVTKTYEITAKEVEIVVSDASKTYGDEDPAFTGTVKGLIHDDDLGKIVYSRVNSKQNAGVYESVLTATYTPNTNYIVGVTNGTFTINKRPATVKADDKSKEYDNDPSTDPELTATVTGAVEGDTILYTLTREEGQDVGEYKITVTAGENPDYEVTVENGTFTITPAQVVPVTNELIRLSGADRYLTAMKAADELKEILGVDKFDNIVLATGKDFADALGGGYLAAKKGAPILLTSDKKASLVNEYINANLKEGGTVYVLGGTAAVSDEALKDINGKVVRLSGKSRYETNLAILNEAGVSSEDILICSGRNFADALAASASGRPMLLVDTKKNALTDSQKDFLSSHTSSKLYILGGTGAVSDILETEVSAYGTPERVKGSNRYETSVAIAKAFFQNPDKALIAWSDDYPDGLCAGPLGYALKAPILLTKEGKESSLKAYCTEASITNGYIIGGDARIPDASARDIFSLPEDTEIVKR